MNVRNCLTSLGLVATLASGVALSGCNTIEGAGKDVKSVGKAVEEEAAEHH